MAWQCGCTPPKVYQDDQAECGECHYISPAEVEKRQAAPQPPQALALDGLSDEQRLRLIGYAQWLDQYLSGKAGSFDPVTAAGIAAILRGARTQPDRTWHTIQAAGAVLDGARHWVQTGEPPDTAPIDRLLGT